MAFKMVAATGPQVTSIMFVWIQILTDKVLNPSSHTPSHTSSEGTAGSWATVVICNHASLKFLNGILIFFDGSVDDGLIKAVCSL